MSIRPAVATLAAVLFATSAFADVPVTVNWNDQKQSIDGFGIASGFNKFGSIYRIPDAAVRSKMLDLLFSREKGIGISIVRNTTGDGGFNRSNWGSLYDGPSDSIWPTQAYGYVWSAANAAAWNTFVADPQADKGGATAKANFDFYFVWGAKEAQARNPDMIFTTCAWSPPAWMKTNNSILGAGDGVGSNGKLATARYQDFADYFAEYVLGYQREFGIPISVVSLTNEPTQAASYSGCVWTGPEIQTFIKNNLGPTFAARNIPAKIMTPEAVNFTETALETATLNDPLAEPYLDIVSTHAYGLSTTADATTTSFPVTLAKQNARVQASLPNPPPKPLRFWETEYMTNGAPGDNFYENTLAGDGLKFSQVMSDMLNNSPALNSYHCWWGVANNGADGSDLIRLCNDGRAQGSAAANFTGTETGQFRAFKRFYAFGHWSRFIQPGYVRIGVAPYRPADGVRVSAFKDPDTGTFVINAINQGLSDQTIALNLSGFPAIGSVVPYVTSDVQNQEKQADIPIVGGIVTATLKMGSITSFVSKDGELPQLDMPLDLFSVLQAERGGHSPGAAVSSLPDGGAAVTGLRSGDNVVFHDVNFADGSMAGDAPNRYLCMMHARVASSAGGTLEAHVDSAGGPLAGTITIPANFTGWARLSTMLDTTAAKAYGIRDLYLVFNGPADAYCFLDAVRFDQGVAARLAADPSSELVVNPGAEITTPLTWTAQGTGNGTLARSTAQAHSGAASLLLSGRSAATRGIGQPLTNKIEAPYVYQLSAWFRPTTSTDTMKAQLSIARNGMPTLLYDIPGGSVSAPVNQWTQLSVNFTMPVPVSMVQTGGINLIFCSTSTTTNFHLDDVSVKLSPAAPGFSATVELGNLDFLYDGSPKAVAPTTSPAGLPLTVTYNGSSSAPSAVGSYAVVATVQHPNYTGSANGTLRILDLTPPSSCRAAPNTLGLPAGQMVDVTVIATDLADPNPSENIIGVTCNQAMAPGDFIITGPDTVKLKCISTGGPGRIYSIAVQCTDSSGNTAVLLATVSAAPLPVGPRR